MEEIRKKLRQMFIDAEQKKQKLYRREGYRILKNVSMDGVVFNIISFDKKGKYMLEQQGYKTQYIEVGEYLISAQSSCRSEEETVNFDDVFIYRIADGELFIDGKQIGEPVNREVQTPETPKNEPQIEEGTVLGKYPIQNILVVDSNMIIVCEKNALKFFIIINEKLCRISSHIAEQLWRLSKLTLVQKKRLVERYPEAGWEIHNGLIINPNTLSVPGILDILCWKKTSPMLKATLFSVDFSYVFQYMFSRRPIYQKHGVRYISSSGFGKVK